MENYKKTIQKRLTLLSMACNACLPTYFILRHFIQNADGFAKGITIGLLTTVEICAIIVFFITFIRMKNEESLMKMYMNDERSKAIRRKSAFKGLIIASSVIGIAAVIAGFFNIKICIALTAVLTLNLFAAIIFKVHCIKTL